MKKTINTAIAFALTVATTVTSCTEQSTKETDVQIEKMNKTANLNEKRPLIKNEKYDPATSSEVEGKHLPPPPPQKIRFIEPKIVEEIGPDEPYAMVDRDGPMNVGIEDGPYHSGSGDYEEVRSEDDAVYFADPMPEFPGGQAKLTEYLKNNITYPNEARDLGIEGKVYVGFVVKADGSISDVNVRRGVHQLLDREAIRVIKSMPKWIPGKQNGKPVNVQMTLPVKFSLTQ